MAEPLHLRKGVTGTIVRVHPLVLFTICDSYIRRGENMTSVIGTLLGVVQDNVVTINDCYSVPHSDNSETVQVDVVHNKTMFDLHQRVNPKEIIVGWFSTGLEISASDALLHDFYNNRQSGSTVKTPVHLRVDTALTEGRMSIKAYVSRQLSLRDKPLATEFLEVPCSSLMEEAESLGLDVLRASSAQTLAADQQHLEAAFRKLKDMLERAEQYVDSVLEGRRKGDVRIGRYLADMLSVVPHMGKAEFQKMFNDSVQDVLLVMYLSSMVRSHIALADRLGTSALPLL